MPNRTFVLFLFFVALLIIAPAFIIFFQQHADALVDNFQNENAICSNITNEKDCYKKDYCEGIYKAGCSACQDKEVEFKYCQRVSDKILVKLEEDKNLCEQTNGKWYRNRLGSSCLCNGDGIIKIFDKEKGCIRKK